MRPHRPVLLLLALVLLAAPPALAQWTGTGDAALVLADTLTVFRAETGEEPLRVLVKDEILVAQGSGRSFSSSSGRVKVEIVVQDGKRLRPLKGWVALGPELFRFTFPCRCAQGCWPFEESGRDVRWNRCVQEAALAATLAAAPAP
jgi:hypothetical protein